MSEFTILGMSQLASIFFTVFVALLVAALAALIIYSILEHNREKELENEKEKEKSRGNDPNKEIEITKTFNNKAPGQVPPPPAVAPVPQPQIQTDSKALDAIDKLNDKMDKQFDRFEQRLINLQDRQQQPQQPQQDNGPIVATLNSLKDMFGKVLDKIIPGNQDKKEEPVKKDLAEQQTQTDIDKPKEEEQKQNEEPKKEEPAKTTTETGTQSEQNELQQQNVVPPIAQQQILQPVIQPVAVNPVIQQQPVMLRPVYQQIQQPQQPVVLQPVYQQQILQPLTRTVQRVINGQPVYEDQYGRLCYGNGQPVYTNNPNVPDQYNPNYQTQGAIQFLQPGQNYTYPIAGAPVVSGQQFAQQPGYQQYQPQPQLQPLLDTYTGQQKISPMGQPLFYDPIKGANFELYSNGQPAKDVYGNYIPYNQNYVPQQPQNNYNPNIPQPYGPQPQYLQQKQILDSIIQKIQDPAKKNELSNKLNNPNLSPNERQQIIDDIVKNLNGDGQTLLKKQDIANQLRNLNNELASINPNDNRNLNRKNDCFDYINQKIGDLNLRSTEPATSQDITSLLDAKQKVEDLKKSVEQQKNKQQPQKISNEIQQKLAGKVEGLDNIDPTKLDDHNYLNHLITTLVDDINNQNLDDYSDELNNDIDNIVKNANHGGTIKYNKDSREIEKNTTGKTQEQKQEAIIALADVKQAIGREQETIKAIAENMGIKNDNEGEENQNLSPEEIANKIVEKTNEKIQQMFDDCGENEEKKQKIIDNFYRHFDNTNNTENKPKYIKKDESEEAKIERTGKSVNNVKDIVALFVETENLLKVLGRGLGPDGANIGGAGAGAESDNEHDGGHGGNVDDATISLLIKTINDAVIKDTNFNGFTGADYDTILNTNKDQKYNVNNFIKRVLEHPYSDSIKTQPNNFKNIVNQYGNQKNYNTVSKEDLFNILDNIVSFKDIINEMNQQRLINEKEQKEKEQEDKIKQLASQIGDNNISGLNFDDLNNAITTIVNNINNGQYNSLDDPLEVNDLNTINNIVYNYNNQNIIKINSQIPLNIQCAPQNENNNNKKELLERVIEIYEIVARHKKKEKEKAQNLGELINIPGVNNVNNFKDVNDKIIEELNNKIQQKLLGKNNTEKNQIKQQIDNSLSNEDKSLIDIDDTGGNIQLKLKKDNQNKDDTLKIIAIREKIANKLDLPIQKVGVGVGAGDVDGGINIDEEKKKEGEAIYVALLNQLGKKYFELQQNANNISVNNLPATTTNYCNYMISKINVDAELKKKIIDKIQNNDPNDPILKVLTNNAGNVGAKNYNDLLQANNQNPVETLKKLYECFDEVRDLKKQIEAQKNNNSYKKLVNNLANKLNIEASAIELKKDATEDDIKNNANLLLNKFNDSNNNILNDDNIDKAQNTSFLEFDANNKKYKFKQNKEPKTQEDYEDFLTDVLDLQKELSKSKAKIIENQIAKSDAPIIKTILKEIIKKLPQDNKDVIPSGIIDNINENTDFNEILAQCLNNINNKYSTQIQQKKDDTNFQSALNNIGLKISDDGKNIIIDNDNKKDPKETLVGISTIFNFLENNLNIKPNKEVIDAILQAQNISGVNIGANPSPQELTNAQNKIIEKLNEDDNLKQQAGSLIDNTYNFIKYDNNDNKIKVKSPTDNTDKFMQFYNEVHRFKQEVVHKLESDDDKKIKELEEKLKEINKQKEKEMLEKFNKKLDEFNLRGDLTARISEYNSTHNSDPLDIEHDNNNNIPKIKKVDPDVGFDGNADKIKKISDFISYCFYKDKEWTKDTGKKNTLGNKINKINQAISDNNPKEMVNAVNGEIKKNELYNHFVKSLVPLNGRIFLITLMGDYFDQNGNSNIEKSDNPKQAIKNLHDSLKGKFQDKNAVNENEQEGYETIMKILDKYTNDPSADPKNFQKEFDDACYDAFGVSKLEDILKKQHAEQQVLNFGAACCQLFDDDAVDISDKKQGKSMEYVFHDTTNRIGNVSNNILNNDTKMLQKPFDSQGASKTIIYFDENGDQKIASVVSLAFERTMKVDGVDVKQKYYIDIPFQHYNNADKITSKNIVMNCDNYEKNIEKALEDPNTPVFIRLSTNAMKVTRQSDIIAERMSFYYKFKDSNNSDLREKANKYKDLANKMLSTITKKGHFDEKESGKKIITDVTTLYNENIQNYQITHSFFNNAKNMVKQTTIGDIYKAMFNEQNKKTFKNWIITDSAKQDIGFYSLDEVKKQILTKAAKKIGKGAGIGLGH